MQAYLLSEDTATVRCFRGLHHLNLRTHLKRLTRRTICFSKSEEMHDKVIGWYLTINHYH
ncbi:IS1 family transposase [Klebsiella quasipneumoniae]|uniref:IS1 family transposase n=1 Tax=Klebsiella quasipneumoniae TaxID=1463165 RepID=UPI0037430F24